MSVLDRGMAIDVVALLRMEVISIVRVSVINERLLRATRLSIECNSLAIARSESVLSVRLESLDFGIASRVVINSESLFRAGAVTTAISFDTYGQAALGEEGGGSDEDLGEMHVESRERSRMFVLKVDSKNSLMLLKLLVLVIEGLFWSETCLCICLYAIVALSLYEH